MELRSLIQEFRSYIQEYRTGISDDAHIPSHKQIYDYFLDARSRYYEQMMSNGKRFNPTSIQSLPCITLEEVDQEECPSIPPSGCVWLKSDKPMPTALKVITVTIGSQNLTYIPWNRCKSIGRKRIKSSRDKKYFTWKETKDGLNLYILNDIFSKNAAITFIAEDPIKAKEFCDPKVACSPLDQDIQTTRKEVEVIMKMMLDTYSRLHPLRQANQDVLNNDKKDS